MLISDFLSDKFDVYKEIPLLLLAHVDNYMRSLKPYTYPGSSFVQCE